MDRQDKRTDRVSSASSVCICRVEWERVQCSGPGPSAQPAVAQAARASIASVDEWKRGPGRHMSFRIEEPTHTVGAMRLPGDQGGIARERRALSTSKLRQCTRKGLVKPPWEPRAPRAGCWLDGGGRCSSVVCSVVWASDYHYYSTSSTMPSVRGKQHAPAALVRDGDSCSANRGRMRYSTTGGRLASAVGPWLCRRPALRLCACA